MPQLHAPAAEQLSAFVGSHATHAFPLVPQLPSPGIVHVVPEQHPFGQDVELQTHMPVEQTWPAPQAGPVPQLHAPDVEQVSAFVGSQATHADPLVPQVMSELMSQTAPAQQPVGQFAGMQPLQTWFMQVCPIGHDWHADPPVPQALMPMPGKQLEPEQHPIGHEVPLQTHWPPLQSCPEAHAAPPPHVHDPPEHPSPVLPHATHAEPAMPQWLAEGVSHTLPLQHPVGHDVGLQTHWPFMHA